MNLHGSFLSDGYIEADFDGDGKYERIRPCEGAGFKLENVSGVEIARTHLNQDFWYRPEVTYSSPHLLLVSTDGYLLVFDKTLTIIRRLSLAGIQAPLHIMGGTLMTGASKGPFVSIFGGRGGWHRSVLFVHTSDDRVIYKEVLVGDFTAVWPQQAGNGTYRFLLGGRGEIYEYVIPIAKESAAYPEKE